MAINAKNIGKIDSTSVKKTLNTTPRSQMKVNKKHNDETPKETPPKANYRIEKKNVQGVASNETALLVNGKQKSIGRKSHYLLDMLTLDDE